MDLRHDVSEFILQNFLYGERSKMPGEDESFLDRGIIDSTGILELVAFLEQKYGITVKDEELLPENLDSIRNVVRYVDGKLNGGASHAAS